jgi:hypothetical protein
MVGLILPYTDTAHCQVRAFQISSLKCGKPWTKGDGDNIEEPNQRCKETTGDQKTDKWGCLKQIFFFFRHPVSSPKDGLQPGNPKCKTVTEEK